MLNHHDSWQKCMQGYYQHLCGAWSKYVQRLLSYGRRAGAEMHFSKHGLNPATAYIGLYRKTQYCKAYFFNILNFFSQKLGCKMRNLAGISRQSLLSLFGRLSCEFYWLPVAICELISLFLSYLASIDFILTMPCCTCFPLSKSFSAMMARAIESGRCSCSRQI